MNNIGVTVLCGLPARTIIVKMCRHEPDLVPNCVINHVLSKE
jgi:hypothetical protein